MSSWQTYPYKKISKVFDKAKLDAIENVSELRDKLKEMFGAAHPIYIMRRHCVATDYWYNGGALNACKQINLHPFHSAPLPLP